MSLIFGNIRDISRYARVTNGTISLINAAITEDPFLVLPTSVSFQTDATGYFETTLGKGDYQLKIGNDTIQFSVTEDGGPFNILNLLTTDLAYTKLPYSSQWNGILERRHLQFIFVPPPATPDVTVSFTSVPTGLGNAMFYNYALSYVTSQGETELTSVVSIGDEHMNPDGGPYGHAIVPLAVSPANVTKKRIWRSNVDNGSTLYLLAELNPDVASYDDFESNEDFTGRLDISIIAPSENTTAGGVYADSLLLMELTARGVDMQNRLRIPADRIGRQTPLEREIQLLEDFGANGGNLLTFRKDGINWIVAPSSNQVSFSRGDTVLLDETIGGIFKWKFGVTMGRFQLSCRVRPVSGSVKVVAVINGVTNADLVFTITSGAGEFTEEIDFSTLETIPRVEGNQTLRFQLITNGSDPADVTEFPAGIDVTGEVNFARTTE